MKFHYQVDSAVYRQKRQQRAHASEARVRSSTTAATTATGDKAGEEEASL